ncbi:helix-turn-helix domain-containing protein [Bifidobacterium samirii]
MIERFQSNLSIIRKVAGWTVQQLADELGVARQTVANLEAGRTPMSKLQYLALRTVFNAEIVRSHNRDLARIIKTLVDDPQTGGDGRNAVGDGRDGDAADGPGTAMQVLTVITGALASGAIAAALAFLMFTDGDGRR